jgi:hypothetical protein
MSEEAVAWIDMAYRAPVVDAAGNVIGTAESLLGDEAEDIFHGIVVKRASDGQLVEVASNLVSRITESQVVTSITPDAAQDLPRYREEKWFHLGWGGVFRKRPGWREE